MSNLINTENLKLLYKEISKAIGDSKKNVVMAVNSEMVILYWNIGKIIKTEILQSAKAEYGKSVISDLSKELTKDYGKGYSQRNLFNMVRFFEVFSNQQTLQTLSAKLSWSHFVKLFYIEDALKREFYITMCNNEHWSVRTLTDRINSMLYERTAISKKPELTIVNDLKQLSEENKMTTDLFFRDPYVLDFLELHDTYSEKDIENAILTELEKFILEMGRDFAFLGRQVRITIGNKDYFIDLLFYHRKLRRLVLIELKLGEFLPEHKGQVELYLRWLQKNEMNEGENSPVAIILCASKSDEEIELLEVDKSGIHVAQYLTQLPPKELFQEKLHKAIERAKEKFEANTLE
ncbi:PDDEXK nuclease domain-containing protein [Clostridium estertheticum]|uniref:Cytoplasmic protein n=1 Tax=Clostridium estertheticum subsp. estertheticum TaxID=1552 RepID=A0A1J0GF09_9CLOT|nr:PDDEXK nuclease domain-containing protein [Clostridium estertheticum]APC39962.1 cytoplasmic protein [Clostridium estertheticum subsp. estertheticum]MBZ9613964.1 PDDEXK nuclease domain-containing protein [Clostridium estertheticum subsp. laramiense]WAG73922.1 PDDEXK nuclease domain-containing protein [Clostridium estertheticum]